MQTQRSYNNSVFIDKKTNPKVPYNYKKRREELNKLVKNHIERQKQRTTQ